MHIYSEVNAFAEKRYKSREKRLIWYRVLSVLMCVTVFFTTYALILPALTFDADTAATCGMISHKHSSACYAEDGSLICGLPEHEHDMACFKPKLEVNKYGCGYAYEHTHGEDCYYDGKLVCTLIEHTHTDACAIQTVKIRKISLGTSPQTPFDIDTGLVTNADNDWQTVDRKYSGNSQTNKISVDNDGDGVPEVYIQKDVIPTDKENEFYVYLSIDIRKTVKELLDDSQIYLINNMGTPLWSFTSSPGNPKHITELNVHGDTGGPHEYPVIINVYESSSSTTLLYSYEDVRSGPSPNCSNGTVFLKLPGRSDYYAVQRGVRLGDGHNGSTIEMRLNLNDASIDGVFDEVVLGAVIDELGDYMTDVDVEDGYCDGTVSYNAADHTITWIPQPNASCETLVTTNPIVGWDLNTAQLVYKVKLDTAKENFQSCAETIGSAASSPKYVVSNQAELTLSLIHI